MSLPARPPAIHFERVVEALPAGRQAVTMLDLRNRQVGSLEFQVCHRCRIGYIGNIAVAGHWQGQGLGRHALHTAMVPCSGYTWSTSRQSSEGRRFFATMADELEVAFPPSGLRCAHIEP